MSCTPVRIAGPVSRLHTVYLHEDVRCAGAGIAARLLQGCRGQRSDVEGRRAGPVPRARTGCACSQPRDDEGEARADIFFCVYARDGTRSRGRWAREGGNGNLASMRRQPCEDEGRGWDG